MKRLFTLVCLFAVFSFAFASNGSFDKSGKDVKQENVQKFIAQNDIQLINDSYVVVNGNVASIEVLKLKSIEKSNLLKNQILSIPDIVQRDNSLYYKNLRKKEKENLISFISVKINNNPFNKRNQYNWRSREILKC